MTGRRRGPMARAHARGKASRGAVTASKSRLPLEVLPPQIGQLQALTKLDLRDSKLKVLPPEIGQLRALTELSLFGCPLVELPPEFGQLIALTDLNPVGCKQLTLAPGADEDQPVQTIVAVYARLLIVKPHKATPGQLHAFLPGGEPAGGARLLQVRPHLDQCRPRH